MTSPNLLQTPPEGPDIQGLVNAPAYICAPITTPILIAISLSMVADDGG
jgi:hypothetical protein